MTSRHLPGNAGLVYFTVTCHLAPIVADLSQDTDYDPNTARIDAVVTFTPKYKAGEVIHSHTSTPATGFLALPVSAMIDDGYLKLRSKPDAGATPLPGTLHGLKAKIAADTGREVETDLRALNYAPVRLLGNSTSLEIDPEIPLYYDFSFSNIKIDGKQTNITITGGTFEAPWEDTVIDLLDYMPLTPGPYAQPMVVGPAGPPGPPGPATVDVGTTTTTEPGTDALVVNDGDTLNARFSFSIPKGEPGPPGSSLTEVATAADLPAGQAPGTVFLTVDTGDLYRADGTKAGGWQRISERVPSTGIEDSTEVGRAVVTAPDEAAARDAIGLGDAPYVPKAAPAVGDPIADAGSLDAALLANSFVRADDGVYVVSAAGVTVPAGRSLLVGEGAAIKLADGQVGGAAGLYTAVQLGDGASFVGAVDGNRAGQDRAAYNAGPGSANRLIFAAGTAEAPLTGLHIDAQVSNAVNSPLRLDHVKDSYVRIRAKDCGGAVIFESCDNLTVDIEVDGTDNLGWKIWQHAVDFGNCTRIRGRVVIRDQSGDGFPSEGTGLSPWNSGLTMVDCSDITFDEVDVDFAAKPNQSKSLGVSLLSVNNIHVGRLRIVGYSDCLLELGGVVDGTFNGLELDGRYAIGKAGNTGSGVGINLYNNGSPANMSGNTLQQTRNLKFIGGSIRRCLGLGINLKASKDTSWYGVEISGCLHGLQAVSEDQWSGGGPAPTGGGNVPKGHRFVGCDFVFNERCGVDILGMEDSAFLGCRANNNSQAVTFGSTRGGLTPDNGSSGFRTRTGTSKTGLLWSAGCQANDVQGTTAPGFLDPARPTVIAVDRPERYGVGQTLTISGAGAGGADLLTRVNGIRHDELTLQHPAGTFPTATLTGTIATSGKAVTGTGTKFLTELVGRAWVKVGAEYRRIAKVTSDTAAVLESAFPANVPAGTGLVVVRATVTAARSQNYGYNFSADTVEPVIGSTQIPAGNTQKAINDLSSGGYRTMFNPVFSTSVTVNGVGSPGEVRASGTNANTSLVLKSQGAGAIWLQDGSENNLLQMIPVAGATSHLQITNQPTITVVSPNTDQGLTISPKGNGRFTVYANTGQTATIQGSGPATDQNLNLHAKGAGVVQIATPGNTPIGQVETKGHTHTVAQVTGAESTANKGAANGYAPLDATSKVPAANLPARWVAVPASATAPGTAGDVAYNATHMFVCVATNTWTWVKLNNTWPPTP